MKAQEAERLAEQVRIDSSKTALERNKMGQFATPPTLARQITEYMLSLRNGEPISFIDPAIGSGSFFSALMHVKNGEHIEQACGIEVDPQFAEVSQRLWSAFGLSVQNADFTLLKPPSAEEDRFNLVLTNPPYVRHHHLDSQNKVRLKDFGTRFLGSEMSGLAGLYCYFMLLSHEWMKKDALAVWLIPSEFMDVNYGVSVKQYLLERVELLHIHRYDPADLQFDDALVSSAIVVFRNKKPEASHLAKFSFGGPIDQPRNECEISISDLRSVRKWTSLPMSEQRQVANANCLSDLFTVRRGIATGSNEFFIMPLSQAQSLGIDAEFCKPILPSPRNLAATVVESRHDGYPDLPEPLTLIDTDKSEEYIKERSPGLWSYLQKGADSGLKETYLISKRRPWYKQEQRDPCPFFCTYMGRSVKKSPFRFIWNKSNAIGANTYLMLYPIGPLKAAMDKDPGLAEKVFEFLENIKLEELVGEGRVYGGGLHKVEPAELGRVDAGPLAELIGLTDELKGPENGGQLSLLSLAGTGSTV
jgi:adenine-specific DNA-methyltransferase